MTDTAMFSAALESLETVAKRDFLALLEASEINPEQVSGQTFARILRFAHFYGIGAGELSSKLRVTLSTVSRWRTGVDHPGMFMRGDAIEFIRQRLRELNKAA
ncbi:MAG: hypothetical protein JWM39_797 [Parcubacteria group bacterium]|nr:hypothetical protein [Parcubacteria group bacterium]